VQADRGFISRNEFWDQAAQIMGTSRQELDKRLEAVRGADWELLEYIKSLRQQYKTAVLSNVGSDFMARVFATQKSTDYFDELVLSFETGVLKPDRRAYETAAKRLGCKPAECLMIDDQQRHCDGAVAAGMQALHYQDFDQFKHDLGRLVQS
jgi:HAD superfamily hydrolase (TIGR01509 family)